MFALRRASLSRLVHAFAVRAGAPRGGARPADDGELGDDDMDVATYDEHEIDLHDIMRDEVLLQLPMRALCSSTCAGLCGTCGKNLNDDACQCMPMELEGPLGALKRIKLRQS